MKKFSIILASGIIFLFLITSLSFAYTANVSNNGTKAVSLYAAGSVISTVNPGSKSPVTLDMYTAYMFKYAGKWAPQGLGTLQKNTQLVYQITPQIPAGGRIPFTINVSDSNASGSINNLTSGGSAVVSGDFFADSGGYTIKLGMPNSINVSFS